VLGVSIIEHTFGARLLTSDSDCESDICRNSGEESESGESCRGTHVESDDSEMYVQVVDDSNSPMIDRKDQSGWKRKKSYQGERKQTNI
jgi:hypothetical protein